MESREARVQIADRVHGSWSPRDVHCWEWADKRNDPCTFFDAAQSRCSFRVWSDQKRLEGCFYLNNMDGRLLFYPLQKLEHGNSMRGHAEAKGWTSCTLDLTMMRDDYARVAWKFQGGRYANRTYITFWGRSAVASRPLACEIL